MKGIVRILGLVALAAIVCPRGASAAIITSSGDPALTGATVIDFEAIALGTYAALVVGDVTFTAQDNHLRISADYAGSYNTIGRSLDNGTYAAEGFNALRIDFASPTSAFGFNWGASDYAWTLYAYDSGSTLLGTYALPITMASNAGEFVGLAVPGISYAVLDLDGTTYDWVFVDNFAHAAPVPEPGTLLLLGGGVLGLIGSRRKARR